MPTASDYEVNRSGLLWNMGMLAAATLVMLFWGLSIADPCLLGHFLGDGNPAMNPIAIATCEYTPETGKGGITRGDLIIRLGALAIVSMLLACVFALVDPLRSRFSIIGISVCGFTIAFLIHFVLRVMVMGASSGLIVFYLIAWLVCAVITVVAAALGKAIAVTTEAEPR